MRYAYTEILFRTCFADPHSPRLPHHTSRYVIQFSLLCYHSWGFVTYKVLDNHVHINFLEIMSAVLTVGFIIDLVIQLNVANPMVRSTPPRSDYLRTRV